MKVKVFNKEKVVLNKIIDVLESGFGLTDSMSELAHIRQIRDIINDYELGSRYYHKLDGMPEDHVKKNYAHFESDKYYSEVEVEVSPEEENRVEIDLYKVIQEVINTMKDMRKELDHVSQGVELIVSDIAMKLIMFGDITDEDIMEVLKQIKK